MAVMAVMTTSAAIAAWQAIGRLVRPRSVHELVWVAAAGVAGFAGNELAARYRIRVGTRIGSAALVADGHHARTDGFTSLAVVAGAGGVALGWRAADPVVGLLITIAILAVLRGAVRDIYRRLMDAVDPDLVDQVEREAATVPGIRGCDAIRVRWIGHQLHAELDLTVDRASPWRRPTRSPRLSAISSCTASDASPTPPSTSTPTRATTPTLTPSPRTTISRQAGGGQVRGPRRQPLAPPPRTTTAGRSGQGDARHSRTARSPKRSQPGRQPR